MDASTNKILIIDSEEMVLDTIETFYPDDEAELFIASSLEDALKITAEHSPSVIVTSTELPDAEGHTLVDRLLAIITNPEIILTSTLDDFKDILAEYGNKVSDVVFKPIDMDILETIIARARKNIEIKKSAASSKDVTGKQEEENASLKNSLLEQKTKAQNFEKENGELKDKIASLEQKNKETENSTNQQQDEASKEINTLKESREKLNESLETHKKEQKEFLNIVTSAVNAVRTAKIKQSAADIFAAFEENLKKIPGVTGVKIAQIDPADTAKINAYLAKIKAGEICTKVGEKTEIPFCYGTSTAVIRILGEIDTAAYNPLLHVFREGLILSLNSIASKEIFAAQLETEKKQTTNVKTIFGNVQMYINKSDADSKVKAVKDELNKTFEDVLNICFDATDALAKIENQDDVSLTEAKQHLSKITDEKAQGFDIFIQKIAHISEVLANIKLGMSGKRVQAVSGDQFLFAEERKQA